MSRGFTRFGRLAFGLQVLLAVGLSVTACLLVLELAEWRFVRVDLSVTGRNTLDPALEDLIDRLPGEVDVDVFFRPLRPPFTAVGAQAQNRMLDLLATAFSAHRDRMEVRVHDPDDVEAVKARQAELGVEGDNLVVVSSGDRKDTLEVFSDVADIDWGNPSQEGVRYLIDLGVPSPVDPGTWDPYRPTPPRFLAFRGGEALAQALKKVSAEGSPRVYLTQGHGEPDPFGEGAENLGLLRRLLEEDGFQVATWDGAKEGAVPADCDVLGMIGATQPLGDRVLAYVRDYLDVAGGRVVVAVSPKEAAEEYPGGAIDLLRAYGLGLQPGIVCQPLVDALGQPVEGTPACAGLTVNPNGMNASHPLTEPLRRRARSLQFAGTRAFRRSDVALPGRIVLELVFSDRDSWRDLPDARGAHDWVYDPATEGERGRNPLCVLAEVPTEAASAGEGLSRARILALADASFATSPEIFAWNRDFLLNAFNWLASRDYRVGVSPADPRVSRIDLERGRAGSRLFWSLLVLLPSSCVATGFGVWLKRRR